MNLNELIETLRVKIINTVHRGYILKAVRLEDDWLDAYEHHIPMFHQAQHILYILDQLDQVPNEIILGFVQGWMFSHEICTINWLTELNNQYLKDCEE